jgi:pimeloyl-ACP methyl ester carboxylesterase
MTNSAIEQAGYIESSGSIPLTEALARWKSEAICGELDTGRYRCRYFVWGRGQPLVFVHGIADCARSFVPVIAHLVDSFRCIAYELPDGAGDGAPLNGLHHRDLVADLLFLLDHLRCEQACAYGASFGSTVVLAALHLHPGRFLRAVIQCGFARRVLAPAEKVLVSLARRWSGQMGSLPLRRWVQRRTDWPALANSPRELWDFHQANSDQTPIRAFAARAAMIGSLDLRPLLPEIRLPVLVMSGDGDPIAGQQRADELVHRLPHADRLVFSNCGHLPQYTHAAGVAEALKRFLRPPCGLSG